MMDSSRDQLTGVFYLKTSVGPEMITTPLKLVEKLMLKQGNWSVLLVRFAAV